jgi:hypothetical protein
MAWIHSILDRLEDPANWGYSAGESPASEPVALAALALAGHGRQAAAEQAARWLIDIQQANGSLGISATESSPQWPTSLAILAWRAVFGESVGGSDTTTAKPEHRPTIRAVDWLLSSSGEAVNKSAVAAHDSTLRGWSWVQETHSWLEPTAFAILALKSCGAEKHARSREGVRLIFDRLLPEGGCNYGNTVVLGQTLKPHLLPSGLVLVALAGETDTTGQIDRTQQYVAAAVGPDTTAASLGWGVIGLAAHGRLPIGYERWLEAAAERTARRGASLPRLTLLTLAALGTETPFVTLTQSRGSA